MLLSPLPTTQLDLAFLSPMPTKTQIFDPDFPEDDEDDDLPPLVEAPCADADDEANEPPTILLTFTRNMTPSFFGAPSDASASVSALDAPSPSPPPPIPQHPPGLAIPPLAIPTSNESEGQRGDEAVVMSSSMRPRGHARTTGISVEPPSPSIADAGSPSPSPVSGDARTYLQTTTGSLSSPSLDLDAVREPASGPLRTSAAGDLISPGSATKPGSKSIAAGQMVMGPPMTMGMGMGAVRPPSYIPRPPNAFILFRAAFVRTHKLGTDGKAVPNSAAAAASMGISALDPSTSVTTITPAESTPTSTTGGKRGRGAAGGGKGENLGGSTATLSKLAGQLWRSLAPDERAIWEDKARVAQAEHRKKYPDWRFRPENASGVLGADDWGGGGGSGGGPGMSRGGGWVVLGAAGASFAGQRGGGGKKGKKKASKAATVLDLPTWATENMGFDENKQEGPSATAEVKESRSDAGVYERDTTPSVEDGQMQEQKRVTRSSSRSSRSGEKGKNPITNAHAAPTVTSACENVSVQDSGAGSGTSSITIRPPPSSRCSPTTTHSEIVPQMSVAGEKGSGEEQTKPEDRDVPCSGSNSWFADLPLTAIHRRFDSTSSSDFDAHLQEAGSHAQARQPPPLSTSSLQVQGHDERMESTSPGSVQSIPPLVPSTSAGTSMHFVPRGRYRLLAHEFEFSGDFFAGSPGSPAPPLAHSAHPAQSSQAALAVQQNQHNGTPAQNQPHAQFETRSESQSRSLTRQQQRTNLGVVRTRSFTHGRTGSTLGGASVRGRSGRAYVQPQVQSPAQSPTQAQPMSASGRGELASPPPLSPALSSPISGGSSSHYSFGRAHSTHSVHSGLGGNVANNNTRLHVGGGGLVSPSSHSNPAMGSNLFVVPSRFPPAPPRSHTRTAAELARAATAPGLSVNTQDAQDQSRNAQSQTGQNQGMVSPGPVERIEPSSLGYALGPAAYEALGMSAGYSELVNWDASQQVHQQQQPQQQIQTQNLSGTNDFSQAQTEAQMSPSQARTQQTSLLSPHQNRNQQQQHQAPQTQTYPTGASTLTTFNAGPSGSSATAQPSVFAHMPSLSSFQPFALAFSNVGMGMGLGAQTPSTVSSMSPNLATVSRNPSASDAFLPSGSSGPVGSGYAYPPTAGNSSRQGQGQTPRNNQSLDLGVGSRFGYTIENQMDPYGFQGQQQPQSQQTSPSSSHNPTPFNNTNTLTYSHSHSPFAPASLQDFVPYSIASNASPTSSNAHVDAGAFGQLDASYFAHADSYQSFGMSHFDRLGHINMLGGIGGLSAVGGSSLDATWSVPIGLAATFSPSPGSGSAGHNGHRQEGAAHGHDMGKR